MSFSISDSRGQATVEAAFLIPLLFLVFGLFLQPVFLLYNRCVMASAAAEGCRANATSSGDGEAITDFIKRRLGAIPLLSPFHLGGRSGWEVSIEGGESELTTVTIVNRVRPLPLFGVTAGLFQHCDSKGDIVQTVRVTSTCMPSWVAASGGNPDAWIGAWA